MTSVPCAGHPDFLYERDFRVKGAHYIAGFDEAGRGSLAGPLVVGMVIFPEELIADGHPDLLCIQDSKVLTLRERVAARVVVEKYALVSTYAVVPPERVDALNVNGATEYAVRDLIGKSSLVPDIAFMDGNFRFNVQVPFHALKKGDSLSLSIAAASVIAKTYRDEIMDQFDPVYPVYGFAKHKGYGTEFHRSAIEKYGPCPIHRISYEPVKSMVASGKNLFSHRAG